MEKYEKLIPIGHPNRPGWKLELLKAIVVHYTGNDDVSMDDAANVRWAGRKYVNVNGNIFEADGKTPFAFGSAQVYIDKDSCTLAIPLDEVSWGVGDRRLPYDALNRGQQPIARIVFHNNQNMNTINVEICNNEKWGDAVNNAMQWIIEFIKSKIFIVNESASLDPQRFTGELKKNEILLLRHFDLTGKKCPLEFVDHFDQWKNFVQQISAGTK